MNNVLLDTITNAFKCVATDKGVVMALMMSYKNCVKLGDMGLTFGAEYNSEDDEYPSHMYGAIVIPDNSLGESIKVVGEDGSFVTMTPPGSEKQETLTSRVKKLETIVDALQDWINKHTDWHIRSQEDWYRAISESSLYTHNEKEWRAITKDIADKEE